MSADHLEIKAFRGHQVKLACHARDDEFVSQCNTIKRLSSVLRRRLFILFSLCWRTTIFWHFPTWYGFDRSLLHVRMAGSACCCLYLWRKWRRFHMGVNNEPNKAKKSRSRRELVWLHPRSLPPLTRQTSIALVPLVLFNFRESLITLAAVADRRNQVKTADCDCGGMNLYRWISLIEVVET